MTWRLDLPISRPLSLNDRPHWAVKSRDVKSLRDAANLLARAAKIPPCPRIHVQLHYTPRTVRGRDRDNLVATLKPILDGLVDARVVPNDTQEYVDWTAPIIDPVGDGVGASRVYVVVQRAAPAVTGAV